MNYFQHFIRNLRRSGRAELPCVGSIETVEGSVAPYVNMPLTIGFGLGGATFFIGWERYGEHILGEESRHLVDNNNSYKKNPIVMLAYDAKRAFNYDLPRIGKALWIAPIHVGKTMVKGNSAERREVIKNIVSSLWTGLTAELLAYVPASIVVERLIPTARDLTYRDWEYWLLWPAALGVGWVVGTLGIAAKLGWDDYRKENQNAKLF